MNELKREDMMRQALECCAKKCCVDCPYNTTSSYRECVASALGNALALLKKYRDEIAKKDAEIERLKRKITGEAEDDFPNCSIGGCEAADAVCHLTCPYSKELADLRRDAVTRLKEKGIDVYIYAMEYNEDGAPYFAFTFDKDKVAEARKAWEEGSIIESCYDEYIYDDFYEGKLNDMCKTITNRYEREKKE